MEYQIVEAQDFGELQEKVNDLLKLGCTLQGGVSVCALGNGHYRYSQAIIKETPGHG
jgi:hypothetical protein